MARVKCPKCSHVNADGILRCVACDAVLPKIHIAESAFSPKAPPQNPQLQSGQKIANRYTVEQLIGRGGMGCIYRVHDNVLGEKVALKTLLPQFTQEKMVVDRFFNEARIARRLAHPNIVRTHDIGAAGNTVYISMEYLQGKNLRDVMKAQPQGKGLPLLELLRVADQLCAALEYAHQYTVHRDIKPENVMISVEGTVKLMDFGISKLVANSQLTGAAVVMGTPLYMPPEQLRDSGGVDRRADLYSLGVVLYEAITGRPPTAMLRPLAEVDPNIPIELQEVVGKCVEPDRNHRYSNARELRSALRAIYKQIENSATNKPAKRTGRNFSFSTRKAVGGTICLALIAGLAAGLFGLEERRKKLVAAARVAPPRLTTEAPPETVQSPEADYAQLTELVSQLQDLAEAEVEDGRQNGSETYDVKRWALDVAFDHWQAAQDIESTQLKTAAREALWASQCFIAVLDWPDGMCFVPPGNVRDTPVAVSAFFMDDLEVSVQDFLTFCNTVEGGWPIPQAVGAFDDPIAGISYYDALAFASWHGVSLPTEAQWMRAALAEREDDPSPRAKPLDGADGNWEEADALDSDPQDAQGDGALPSLDPSYENDISWCGVHDLAGSALEWTSSPFNGPPHSEVLISILLGTKMAVRGGWGEDEPLQSRQPYSSDYPVPYSLDYLDPGPGFRCVYEVPASLSEVQRFVEEY